MSVVSEEGTQILNGSISRKVLSSNVPLLWLPLHAENFKGAMASFRSIYDQSKLILAP